MRWPDPALSLSLSELFINLSAGWFGAAIIIPFSTEGMLQIHFVFLTVDIVLGILCFVIGYQLKRRNIDYD